MCRSSLWFARFGRPLAPFVALLLAVGLAACQSGGPEPTLVVENGRVIVGDGPVLEEGSVVVAGDSILSVTSDPVEVSDARRINASGKTVLPGLIDAHVHLTIPPDGRDSTALVRHMQENVPGILQGFLEHGVTTVRSTGEYWPHAGKLRDRVTNGELEGPRIVTAGRLLTAAGAHPVTSVCAGIWSGLDLSRPDPFCRAHLAEEVTTPEEAQAAVEQMAEEGVDFIKVVSDTINGAPVQIESNVTQAIIDQAHDEGLRAAGHVAQTDFMARAAEAGVDGFVHLPLDTLSTDRARRFGRTLAKHETPVTTTLSLVLLSLDRPTRPTLQGNSPWSGYGKVWARNATTLAEAGVPLVVGTDWCPCFPGALGNKEPPIQPGAVTHTELRLLRWGGISRGAILQAATSNAARALEMGDEIGTVEAGKLADLIVVDGNPLEDLSALDSIEAVVQGGRVVAGPAE